MKGSILSSEFYANHDVVEVSRDLLGKFLCTNINGEFTSGMITETEAYCGRNDKACHANNGKRTERTKVMFGKPGHAYIYLCYGIHHLFNVVTNREGLADAVLIRGIQPIDGLGIIKERRQIASQKNLCNGPGKLTQALGIRISYNRHNVSEPPIWIEDREIQISPGDIVAGPRIGVDYAGEDALKPWRFTI